MYIYSDECGFWGDNQEPFYVRTWVRLTERGNKQVEILFDSVKPGQEIKWSTPGSILSSQYLPKIEAHFFITVTPLAKFREQNFKILRAIDGIDDSKFTGYKAIQPNAIRAKMKDATRQIIFLSYHEKQHLKNALDALGCDNNTKVIIDTPQFASHLYRDMLNSISITSGEKINNKHFLVRKSKDFRGIQLADLVAGATREFLLKDAPSQKCSDFLKIVVRPRMLNMTSKQSPNPNMVFWDAENVGLIQKFNNLRNL